MIYATHAHYHHSFSSIQLLRNWVEIGHKHGFFVGFFLRRHCLKPVAQHKKKRESVWKRLSFFCVLLSSEKKKSKKLMIFHSPAHFMCVVAHKQGNMEKYISCSSSFYYVAVLSVYTEIHFRFSAYYTTIALILLYYNPISLIICPSVSCVCSVVGAIVSEK